MRHSHSRAIIDMEPVTTAAIRNIVRGLFHRRHDYGDYDLTDVAAELEELGVSSIKQLRLLMKRHRRAILMDERGRMSRAETLYLLAEFGPQGVDAHTNTSWFAIPGLVREALEKEFGWERVIGLHERQSGQDPAAYEPAANPGR
jgi:hypothetical protein